MKKLPILCILAIVTWSGLTIQQRRARALQSEPASETRDTTDEANPGAAAEDDSATDDVASDAAGEAASDYEPDPETVAACINLLQQARDRLYAYKSVQARIVERATFGTRSFTAEGFYITGKFPQMRLEYTLQVGGSEGKLIEVCDGQILRSSKEIRTINGGDRESADQTPDEVQVTRKEVRKIMDAGNEAGAPQAIVQAELGLGGVPTLLAALESAMVFDAMREDTWKGHSYTVIEGQWKEEYLEKVAPQLGQSAQMMVRYMPERVRVYFDVETLFPMRILYLKRIANEPKTFRAILALEMSDVRFNEEIDAEVFRYIPPEGVNEIDETALYLQMIEAMRVESPTDDEAAAERPDATEPAP